MKKYAAVDMFEAFKAGAKRQCYTYAVARSSHKTEPVPDFAEFMDKEYNVKIKKTYEVTAVLMDHSTIKKTVIAESEEEAGQNFRDWAVDHKIYSQVESINESEPTHY